MRIFVDADACPAAVGDFVKGGHDGKEKALEVCARAIAAAVAHVRGSRARKESAGAGGS